MVLGEGSSGKKKVKIVKPPPKRYIFSARFVDSDPLIRHMHSMILDSLEFKVEVDENGKRSSWSLLCGATFQLCLSWMELRCVL